MTFNVKRLNMVLLALIIGMFSACSKTTTNQEKEEPEKPNPVDSTDGYDTSGLLYPKYEGLVMAGYQGWFNAEGDGANRGWYHYQGDNNVFEPGVTKVDFWPDMTEYTKKYKSPFKFADGSDAYLFSSNDEETIDLHFKWMKDYGIDGVHMQRFLGEVKPSNPSGKAHFNKVLTSALKAAKKYGRAISIMYDLSGSVPQDFAALEQDWKELVETHKLYDKEANPTYLWHNGKPLMSIWGVGFSDDRQYSIQDVDKLVDKLKAGEKKVSIMLGIPYYWRTLDRDTEPDPALHALIKKADIIMPWAVGRYKMEDFNPNIVREDMQWAAQNKVDYVPLVFPGFSWGNLQKKPELYYQIPRLKGDFIWKQMSNAISAGAMSLYVAMFDEIDEGTAIFKSAREKDTPLNGDKFSFVGIENDLPTDHYLWLTGESAKWIKGGTGYTAERPVRP